MDEDIVKKFVVEAECKICGRCYELDNVDVLGNHEDLWFLSAFCPTCHTQYLMAAVVTEEGVSEVITDLTEAELVRFRDMSRLTADDVLDMHNFLNAFEGDISQLFK